MQLSHSRIDTFESCPFRYKMRYIDRISTLKADNADNALFLGTALHTGLEKGVDVAIKEYYMQYPVITDLHINEAMKLEVMIPKAAAMIPEGEFEVNISNKDFTGFIDLLAPVKSNTRLGGDYQDIPNLYDLYDFKYSNNVSHYEESVQLHLYKYFFEKCNPGKKIRNLYYLCVPKVNIKQKKTEDLNQFRKRIQAELADAEPNLVQVEYDQGKVLDWMFNVKHTLEATEFPQNKSWLCRYCDYSDYCTKGETYMLLPKNERRNIEKVTKKVIWIYGSPFSGKTTFANNFPDPLMLNTDGNIKFVDAPYIAIKDKVEVQGRKTVRTLAWDILKDVISELEKKDNDFKTIILDLTEDFYEHCRLWMYDQMGITHESDDSFRAWDKVRTEFLSTMKKLMNLEYENIILISHEDTTKDLTKKGGDKLTSIKPNIQDKIANKLAGMVDIVARVVADGDVRTLSFKTNEVIFGGGRLTTSTNEIPLDYERFLEVYEEANKNAVESMKEKPAREEKTSKGTNTQEAPEKGLDNENMSSDGGSDAPVAKDAEQALADEVKVAEQEAAEQEDKPRTRRTRRTRGEQ